MEELNTNTEINLKPLEEKPEVTLIGEDGNAFRILGLCQKAARNKYTENEWKEIRGEMMSSDYDHLLVTAMYFFDVN
jgi:hypothetical protein